MRAGRTINDKEVHAVVDHMLSWHVAKDRATLSIATDNGQEYHFSFKTKDIWSLGGLIEARKQQILKLQKLGELFRRDQRAN